MILGGTCEVPASVQPMGMEAPSAEGSEDGSVWFVGPAGGEGVALRHIADDGRRLDLAVVSGRFFVVLWKFCGSTSNGMRIIGHTK